MTLSASLIKNVLLSNGEMKSSQLKEYLEVETSLKSNGYKEYKSALKELISIKAISKQIKHDGVYYAITSSWKEMELSC